MAQLPTLGHSYLAHYVALNQRRSAPTSTLLPQTFSPANTVTSTPRMDFKSPRDDLVILWFERIQSALHLPSLLVLPHILLEVQ